MVEVAKNSGCNKSELFDFSKNLPIDQIKKSKTIGLTSGASAPEKLIQNFISEIKNHCKVKIEEIITLIQKKNLKIIDILTDDGDLEDVFLGLTKNWCI